MATIYTSRFIGVVRSANAGAANAASKTVDALGGEKTFTVPLRNGGDATNQVRYYWCGWTLTDAELTGFRNALRDQGFRLADTTVIAAGTAPNTGAQTSIWIFDGREGQWTAQQVLTALSIDTLAVVV